MPPLLLLATVRWRGRRCRVWVPLFLVWLLLLPAAVLLFPVFVVLCLALRTDTLAAMDAIYDLLSSLSGVRIEIDSPDSFIFIRFI